MKVNLADKLSLITEFWSPKIVGALNGQHVKLAKLKGEFVWHKHDNEDELFLVINGELEIMLRNETIKLEKGDFYIVPKGVEHKPIAKKEVEVLLFEPISTLNTGNTENSFTKHKIENI